MKRILLFLVCLLCINIPSYAITTNEYVSALEKKLFGVTYENQSLNERVDRIELQIYDNNYSGNPEERLSKIDKIYPKNEFDPNFTENKTSYNNSYDNSEYDYNEEETSNYNNYPIVSEIEQNIYKKDFSGEDIYKRLSRLEKELYGNEKSDLSLEKRVENLKSLLPKKEKSNFNNNDLSFKDFSFPSTNNYQSIDTDQNAILQELEMLTFRRLYLNDSVTKRIERLERYYTNGISSGQTNEERLNRIAAIALSSNNMDGYYPNTKGMQWAEILMSILMIGLGFLL